MRGLAVGADENLELHAHILKAHAIFMRAGGTSFVVGQAPQLVEVLHVILSNRVKAHVADELRKSRAAFD